MNSQQLLYLALFIGAAIALYLVFARKGRQRPVRLRMKDEPSTEIPPDVPRTEAKGVSVTEEDHEIAKSAAEILSSVDQFPEVAEALKIQELEEMGSATPEEPIPELEAAPELEPVPAATQAPIQIVPVVPIKTQKVYFAFNGHDWEAYEALGVPVNAKLTTVTKMYQHLIKTSDSSTFDFYESAYNAIIKRRKDNP